MGDSLCHASRSTASAPQRTSTPYGIRNELPYTILAGPTVMFPALLYLYALHYDADCWCCTDDWHLGQTSKMCILVLSFVPFLSDGVMLAHKRQAAISWISVLINFDNEHCAETSVPSVPSQDLEDDHDQRSITELVSIVSAIDGKLQKLLDAVQTSEHSSESSLPAQAPGRKLERLLDWELFQLSMVLNVPTSTSRLSMKSTFQCKHLTAPRHQENQQTKVDLLDNIFWLMLCWQANCALDQLTILTTPRRDSSAENHKIEV